ncbi:unnamed protein product [Prorocentrum cordatum]|uniref:Nudix hydrolase domain-containing protein n=1 Tax=Prorocentrum cordatum TaxID=2364126 RepID=A0ABN9Y8E9_9DINO|nr:unnamed protein product [Polarella glacialis]
MIPSEVDSPDAISSGSPMGVKHAAVRKLGHELGIPKSQLDASRFKFITRVHYWAADVGTHGAEAPWGEHEIDYLLLYKLRPGEVLDIMPHPDEVSAVKWLAREELREAIGGTGPLAQELRSWSPWFRVIAQSLLDPWWADLDAAIATDKFVDVSTILGAAPSLDAAMGAERAALRQGGEDAQRRAALAAEREDRLEGLADFEAAGDQVGRLLRPLEAAPAPRLELGGLLADNMRAASRGNPDIARCDDMLASVSRSVAAVVRQLPPGLCLDVCVLCLALCALCTVEGDTERYRGREHAKETELRDFCDQLFTDDDRGIHSIGAGNEAALLRNFGAVSRIYKTLPEGSRGVIWDTVNKVGAGMAEHATADLGQGTVDQASYDRYCHMTAGSVGEGFTRLFVARGVEADAIMASGERVWPFCADAAKECADLGLAHSSSLFLQKASAIRDYLEDYVGGQAVWPQSVWRKHAKTRRPGRVCAAHRPRRRPVGPPGGCRRRGRRERRRRAGLSVPQRARGGRAGAGARLPRVPLLGLFHVDAIIRSPDHGHGDSCAVLQQPQALHRGRRGQEEPRGTPRHRSRGWTMCCQLVVWKNGSRAGRVRSQRHLRWRQRPYRVGKQNMA